MSKDFLIALDGDGKINFINASQDTVSPNFSDPVFPTTLDANITIFIDDDYLDYSQIIKENFEFINSDTNVSVGYSLSWVSDNTSVGVVFNPDDNLTSGATYIITTKASFKDLLGLEFNSGFDQNTSFTAP